MAPVTIPPVEHARSIFTELGYTVSGDGTEFRAERKWRTVHVTALDADSATDERALADGGTDERDLRCYVTYHQITGDLRERLDRADPPFEWAIIGVDDESDDYDVVSRAESV
jgi:hypothetical protein